MKTLLLVAALGLRPDPAPPVQEFVDLRPPRAPAIIELAAAPRPPKAPPIDERLTGIEDRLKSLEERVQALEQGNKAQATKDVFGCPCEDGGKCICPPDDCDCKDCPVHKEAKPKAGTLQFTGRGVEVLLFTADWCVPCQHAKTRLGDMLKDIVIVDCTADPLPSDARELVDRYYIKEYPTCVLLRDGSKVSQCSGEYVGTTIVGDWLAGNLPPFVNRIQSQPSTAVYDSRRSVTRYGGNTWTWPGSLSLHLQSTHGINTSGMSHSEMRAVHDNLHNHGVSGVISGERTIRRVYNQPQQYFRSNSYCPSCSR